MSPSETAGVAGMEISTGQSTVLKIVVDGHEFSVDFDDVGMLRELQEVNASIHEIAGKLEFEIVDEATERAALDALMCLADKAKYATERALGEGAYATLFGDSVPLLRAMKLVTQLTLVTGKAYDAMFREYLPTDLEVVEAPADNG